MSRYLYRGVSVELDFELCGKLKPKQQGEFLYEFTADSTELTCDNGRITLVSSEVNAVHRHQLLQKGYPTSGISTSPRFEVARKYAKGILGYMEGYIYKIDRSLLPSMGIMEYVVSEFVANPAVPEDEEVILVSDDGGELSENIIIEKRKV
jgi:hypothetical protein